MRFGSKYMRVGALVDIEPERKIKFGKASGEAMRMYLKSHHLILDNQVDRSIKLMGDFGPLLIMHRVKIV